MINEQTGVYLAGGVVGVTDLIHAYDLGCEGAATSSLRVVEPLELSPLRPEVARGQALQFSFEGGSGEVRFSMLSSESGGSVTEEGRYLSGDALGEDRLEALDVQTGERALAVIKVVQIARLEVNPQQLWLPLGAHTTLSARGGSGVYDLELRPSAKALMSALAEVEVLSDGATLTLRALSPGEATLWVKDRFVH